MINSRFKKNENFKTLKYVNEKIHLINQYPQRKYDKYNEENKCIYMIDLCHLNFLLRNKLTLFLFLYRQPIQHTIYITHLYHALYIWRSLSLSELTPFYK